MDDIEDTDGEDMDYQNLSEEQKASLRAAVRMVIDASKQNEKFITVDDTHIEELAEEIWEAWMSRLTRIILRRRHGPLVR